jgi:glycine hydroxymethyltransferase
MPQPFEDQPLEQVDPEIAGLIEIEKRREVEKLRLIASENYASSAVLKATGSVFTNKYSEGYVGRRYYEGQQVVDLVETLAVDRVKALFGAEHVNVQPLSGSPANLAVYLALCKPGDCTMGMALPAGGHLTHGWKVSITGKYFNAVGYGVDKDTHLLDYAVIRKMALESKPKLIFCGTTAYPRFLDFGRFREIADEVGAVLCADISHIAGLVVAGVHPSPIKVAQIVTTTTHKTLRGPRGAVIMTDAGYADVIDKAVFPGLQGGPHTHTTAAIAVAAREASTPAFRQYGRQTVANAASLAEALKDKGFELVTGGTDNHLIVVDMVRSRGVSGKLAAKALDKAGIVCNYNSVPFDSRKPFDPSGIRLGTPAITSRGMKESDMSRIAEWIDRVVADSQNESLLTKTAAEVREFCAGFPAPGITLTGT